MDKKDSYALPYDDACPQIPPTRMIVGTKQLRKALLRHAAREVYLAIDADPAVTQPIAQLCAECGIVPRWVPSKQKLGQLCGIDVSAAAAAAVD